MIYALVPKRVEDFLDFLLYWSSGFDFKFDAIPFKSFCKAFFIFAALPSICSLAAVKSKGLYFFKESVTRSLFIHVVILFVTLVFGNYLKSTCVSFR